MQHGHKLPLCGAVLRHQGPQRGILCGRPWRRRRPSAIGYIQRGTEAQEAVGRRAAPACRGCNCFPVAAAVRCHGSTQGVIFLLAPPRAYCGAQHAVPSAPRIGRRRCQRTGQEAAMRDADPVVWRQVLRRRPGRRGAGSRHFCNTPQTRRGAQFLQLQPHLIRVVRGGGVLRLRARPAVRQRRQRQRAQRLQSAWQRQPLPLQRRMHPACACHPRHSRHQRVIRFRGPSRPRWRQRRVTMPWRPALRRGSGCGWPLSVPVYIKWRPNRPPQRVPQWCGTLPACCSSDVGHLRHISLQPPALVAHGRQAGFCCNRCQQRHARRQHRQPRIPLHVRRA